ncbi:DUF881 domain-containing protein [Nocardioides campestrisoli]|uniref:DUF881 domain-containing protein n=1 Tax=Nocardioides campestrisoli TaxID=2736757 RepID=UPI0015E68C77|nr:DUF881 domain-containing protein [Nocardioides campestrisoli]
MEPSTHESPARRRWRLATPAVFVLCGVLLAVSAANSDGGDLRPTRYTDLASYVEAESDEATALTARVGELTRQNEQLSQNLGDRAVNRFNAEIDVLQDPAGLTPRSGPAVTVTLDDAPAELIAEADGDTINDLVVHQQDLQAVVNAMWSGGATAVTLQGQRLISTTGIKCSGNTVQLQGVPYSPPYVITAIGDQGDILRALEGDTYLDAYRDAAFDPQIAVGWDVAVEDFKTAPPYDGLLDIRYAQPIDG